MEQGSHVLEGDSSSLGRDLAPTDTFLLLRTVL